MTQKKRLTVTLDTNLAIPPGQTKHAALHSILRDVNADVVVVSVTERENKGRPTGFRSIFENMVWGESSWGDIPWGGKIIRESSLFSENDLHRVSLFEELLGILSNRSFPRSGEREHLTKAQVRQMRDALILEAHIAAKRDVFITDDNDFIGENDRVRQLISEKYHCTILKPDEAIQAFMS